MRSLLHLLMGGPPLVNGDYEICMDLPLATSNKAAFYIQKLEICMKPLRRVGYEVSFPTFNGRTPPGKQGLLNLHGTPPCNLKKCGKKLEICMNSLRRMGYEVSFPSFNGRTPLVNGDYEICMELSPPTSKKLFF